MMHRNIPCGETISRLNNMLKKQNKIVKERSVLQVWGWRLQWGGGGERRTPVLISEASVANQVESFKVIGEDHLQHEATYTGR